jgi:hypothetical protein
MRKLSIFALGSVLGAGLFLGACSEDDNPISEVEDRVDCAEACSDWQECIGDQVDVTECTDICEDRRDDGSITEDRVEDCSDCLDAASADECSTACTTECAGVLTGA